MGVADLERRNERSDLEVRASWRMSGSDRCVQTCLRASVRAFDSSRRLAHLSQDVERHGEQQVERGELHSLFDDIALGTGRARALGGCTKYGVLAESYTVRRSLVQLHRRAVEQAFS